MANTHAGPVLRIFSYLPNPRIWKSLITARLAGLEVEVVGATGGELGNWLWDFSPRPLAEGDRENASYQVQGRTGFKSTLYKTPKFRRAHPYGTVPAGFSPDGTTGVFESNSIMRAVARQADPALGLYGHDVWTASRVDSFLDVALVFARDSQVYLLSFGDRSVSAEIHARAQAGFDAWMGGVESALADGTYLVGNALTIADVCFACEVTLFSRERAALWQLSQLGCEPCMAGWEDRYPRAAAHYAALCNHESFAPDMSGYLEKLDHDVERAVTRLNEETA